MIRVKSVPVPIDIEKRVYELDKQRWIPYMLYQIQLADNSQI